MTNKDYYSILGVDRNASESDIKKAFRKLAAQYHPDKQTGKPEEEKKAAEDKFKDINEAYQVLSDSEKKSHYDRFGTIDDMGMNGGPSQDDLMNMFRHMHEGFFGGNPFGNFGAHENTAVNGSNTRITVDCTLEDVYNGVTKKYRYKRMAKCPDCKGSGSKTGDVEVCKKCNGTGQYRQVFQNGWGTQLISSPCDECNGTGKKINNPCKSCHGSGLVEKKEEIEISIPNNVRNGMSTVIKGKGNEAPNNLGVAGDLIVTFNVRQHDIFGIDRNGIDLYCKTNINVLDCITGCEKTVKCIDGSSITIKVPQGSKENTKVVVSGKGMPYGNRGFGNMIVYINQTMPKSLTKDEEEKLNELKTSKNFKK